MDAGCTVLIPVECITGGNMALYNNNNHSVHYHTDAVKYSMLGLNYFRSPGYLGTDQSYASYSDCDCTRRATCVKTTQIFPWGGQVLSHRYPASLCHHCR